MMIKNMFPLFMFAALLLGTCQVQASSPAATYFLTQAKKAGGTYTGTIPCADCNGIKLELTLQDSQNGKSKTYVLKQTYLGKPAGQNTSESRGKWFAATGNSKDPKAVIYQLIPDKAYEPLYFIRLSDKAIKMLDQDQQEIASKANYTLQKQR